MQSRREEQPSAAERFLDQAIGEGPESVRKEEVAPYTVSPPSEPNKGLLQQISESPVTKKMTAEVLPK